MTNAVAKVQGDAFSVYYGEFLVSPCPVELSFNYCSHKCSYCFANLNKRGRWADSAASLRLLADMDGRKTLLAHLLRERHPVLVSNRTDPFAATNWRVSLPILRVLAEMGVPVSIQTRGGKGADEAMDFLPPSVWYVSLTTLDDDVRRRVEPGAPTVESRLGLIRSLAARGHRVVIGFNPAVPEWQPDPEALMAEANEAGAEGAWVETLHFSRRQIDAMTDSERAAIGPEVIARSLRKVDRDDWNYFLHARRMAVESGLEVFSNGQARRSDFWRPWRDLYPNTFPVLQDLVNACHDQGAGPNDLVTAEDWADFFEPDLPAGEWDVHHYLGATSRTSIRDKPFPPKATYRQLLMRAFWDASVKFSPSKSQAFRPAAERFEDGYRDLVDARRRPYMVFGPDGHETDRAFVEV